VAPRKATKAAAPPDSATGLRRGDLLPGEIDANAISVRTTPQADALAVYGGAALVGSITERGGKHRVFDSAGNLVGTFTSRLAAMRAIPVVRT
jgi:hypothetical protein